MQIRLNNMVVDNVTIAPKIPLAGRHEDLWLVTILSGELPPIPYRKWSPFSLKYYLSKMGIAPEFPIFRMDDREEGIAIFTQPFNGMGWQPPLFSESDPIWFSRN